ncbi:hypothetical protein BDV30DRAFT_214303 [Aspergillus minisclerotigenes]|uniref:Uncharacterized protein n=1 Tax=Aspergillus minisclerotigenes TaxID=656917 RepID=A0A5N6IW29_9EURO|nr:hypothetical protein BDV30DRAFT_214303 [Aspergillus minisclerotigenes]
MTRAIIRISGDDKVPMLQPEAWNQHPIKRGWAALFLLQFILFVKSYSALVG